MNLENNIMDNLKEYYHTKKNNVIWYIIPKTGTRSMHQYFKDQNFTFPVEKRSRVKDLDNCIFLLHLSEIPGTDYCLHGRIKCNGNGMKNIQTHSLGFVIFNNSIIKALVFLLKM